MVRLSTAAALATGAFAIQQTPDSDRSLDVSDAASALVQKREDPVESPLCGEKVLDFALCDDSEQKNNLLKIDNLAGTGTNDTSVPHEMRWACVAKVAGIGCIDFVITNTSRWEWYNLNKGHGLNSSNPCLAGINIQTRTKTNLKFRLTKSGDAEPLRGGPFDIPFTIMDVDSQDKKNKEYILIDDWRATDTVHQDPKGLERVYATASDGELHIESAHGKAGIGKLSDNPTERSVELTGLERERAVEVRFNDRHVAEWSAEIGVVGGDKGRHFFFAGGSNIPGTHTTTLCACQEWPKSTFDWRLCGDDINGNPVVANNLGAQGPEKSHKPEIRYGGVAFLGGELPLDLVVTAKSAYKPNNVSRNTVITPRVNASIHKCYGAINVANSESVKLQFQFVHAETDEPAELGPEDSFAFTIYDLDGVPGTEGGDETVTFLDPMPSGQLVGNDVDVEVNDGNVVVSSRVAGTGSDNPLEETDSNDALQMSRSASVMYVGTGTFNVVLAAAERPAPGGRNFLFQGCRVPGRWLEWPLGHYGQSRK